MRLLTISSLVLALAFGAGAAQAAKKKSESGGGQSMRMGFGGAYIAAPGAAINALSFDAWVMDDLAVEAVLGAGSGSFYRGGTDAAGRPVNDAVTTFGIGGGGRFNLASPTDYLHLQAVARLSFESSNGNMTVLGRSGTTNSSLIALYGGAGFEVFIPSAPNLSIEMNAGLNVLMGSTTLTPAVGISTSYTESNFFLGGGNSVLPLNLGIHYYF